MRTTLLAALRAWREVGEPGTHATPDELYALASAGAADASASVVVHLTRCGPCAGEFAVRGTESVVVPSDMLRLRQVF